MKNNYVILEIKTNGSFDIDNEVKIISISAIKTDKKLNKISEISLDMTGNEKSNIMKFINFCNDSNIIVYNANKTLSFILKMLYKNKVYNNFVFKYIDIKNFDKYKYNLTLEDNLTNLYDIYRLIVNYLDENNIDNLEDLLFMQQNHGKIFRGLNYPKYLCDIKTEGKKYYGYIIDFSKDRYVSYYSCLKELNSEYFNITEAILMKNLGAKIIMNIGYLNDETLSITNYYSLLLTDSDNISNYSNILLNKFNKYVKYKKDNKNLKLILWGNIDKLKETEQTIDCTLANNFTELIEVVKKPWDYFNVKEI